MVYLARQRSATWRKMSQTQQFHQTQTEEEGRWRKSGREVILKEMSYQFKLNIRSDCSSEDE